MSRRKRAAEERAEADTVETPYLSRTERTRATNAVNKLGLRLAELRPATLDTLELPEELREAIEVCRKIKTKAKSRQKKLICQILRGEDHEAIAKRVEAMDAEAARLKNKHG